MAYGCGEISSYSHGNEWRMEDVEAQKRDFCLETMYNDLRRAADAHKKTRAYIRSIVKPGMSMMELCEEVENAVRTNVKADGLNAGIAFPTGCSLNNCAAHYTPNNGDQMILKAGDVCKLDIGVHVNGWIIDSAFTITFDEKYDKLKEAVREATNTGVREAGIDARICEIGQSIQEVMESYTIDLDGKTYDIKAVRNLSGHSIEKYKIHGKKTVPIVRGTSPRQIMEEGELYAIETFGSTGRGYVTEGMECSHYMKTFGNKRPQLLSEKAVELWKTIEKNFGTLPFCRRYLDKLGQRNYMFALSSLCKSGAITPYPPLCDIPGSYVAQYEHTVLLRPTCKEVLSRGDDY